MLEYQSCLFSLLCQMNTRISDVITLQGTKMLNHYIIHLKLM